MKGNDVAVEHFVQQSMVARIATLSHNGRPSITPLYFVTMKDHIWLGTADWTLAAREVKDNPYVSVLFQMERNSVDRRILRLTGSAKICTDAKIVRASNLRMALKYILSPGGIRNHLVHFRLLPLNRLYHIQSAEKGAACIIDFVPEQCAFLDDC